MLSSRRSGLADGTITAGHHVHVAAIGLGWDLVAVVFENDDEATAQAFALADDRTSDLSRYDHESLAEMMARFFVHHLSTGISTAFSA
ncbi:MAG: hypothetical protein N2037_01180 [Acidimicrobiales bacterium]|nr:hypothetical protein [Acidimicrobiales bacterium]